MAAFGIHLGSRVDLFSGVDCLRLLEIPDQAPPSRPERVAALLERELGGGPEALFELFDARPFDSGLLTQRHRARLPGGAPVTVELRHPELEAALAGEELATRAARLIAAGELPAEARRAVAQFERGLDLRRAARALAELGEETSGSRWVEVPQPHLELCSPRVRVLSTVAAGEPAGSGAERARRLCRVWLAMALDGELFPLEPWGRNVGWPDAGRVAFLGGELHRLPRAWQGELRDYLAAVAARQPARAALAFLDLVPDAPARRRLRNRLRHTDPFRDRGWDVGGDRFARQVLAHWRTAAELGHRLPEGLAPFYRGLFLLNQEVRRLTEPGADEAAGLEVEDPTAVRDGLREARLLLLFGELGEDAEAGRWAGAVERQMTLLSGLPRKLDRILTLAAGEDRPDRPEDGDREERPAGGRAAGWPAVAGCLLALTAVVALAHRLAEGGAFGAVPERIGALLVLLLGGLAVGVAGRRGDS